MSLESRIKKLENKRPEAGPERILITYPDGAARYICGNEKTDLPRGEPWPAYDTIIRIEYDDRPLPQHGEVVDLSREGDN